MIVEIEFSDLKPEIQQKVFSFLREHDLRPINIFPITIDEQGLIG